MNAEEIRENITTRALSPTAKRIAFELCDEIEQLQASLNIQRCIDELVDEGFQVKVGKHHGKGYFAAITKNNKFCTWDQSGHGWTKEEALENAELIIRGLEPVTAYSLADFEKKEKGIVIWIDKNAIGAGCNQRALVIETIISDRHTAKLSVRLLGNGAHYQISPCSIVGVDFDETLTVKFKYNGYTTS